MIFFSLLSEPVAIFNLLKFQSLFIIGAAGVLNYLRNALASLTYGWKICSYFHYCNEFYLN